LPLPPLLVKEHSALFGISEPEPDRARGYRVDVLPFAELLNPEFRPFSEKQPVEIFRLLNQREEVAPPLVGRLRIKDIGG
jgi:hypothetical protein